jgi:peptidoglycan/LPS O-acetylase OafA/YrhL
VATNPPQLERRPDIDGLRAVAIIPVVLFHAGLPAFEAGYVGVDIFYVISGYLITRIIWNEVATIGRFRFGNFYARRARRLLPAALLVIVATAAALTLLYPPLQRSLMIKSGLWSLVYASNIHFLLNQTNYFAGDFVDPFLHTWSLSVEEQFYLFWPLLILLAHRVHKARATLITVMVVVAVPSLAACVIESYKVQPTAFFLLPYRAWEFAAGALASCAARPGTRAALAMAMAGIVAIGISLFAFPADVTFPGVVAIVPVIGTVALLIAGNRDQVIARGLQHPAMRYIGAVSYSWYLWHWPLIVIGEDLLPGGGTLAVKMALAALSFAMAAATFRWVERPLRQNRFFARSAAHTLLPMAAVSGLCVGALIGAFGFSRYQLSTIRYRASAVAESDAPQIPAGCMVQFTHAMPAACSFGDGARTVVLFGDSHAEMWFPAVHAAARKRGYRLVTLLKSSCPAADVPVFNPRIGRVEVECAAWRDAAIARIRALDPSVIFVASANSYVRGPGRTSGYATNSEDDWRIGYERTLGRLPAGSRVLLVEDVPRFPFAVPWCLERAAAAGRGDCSAPRNIAVDEVVHRAQAAASAGHGNVAILSFTDAMCDAIRCHPVVGKVIAYRDSNHVTASFAKAMSARFCDQFLPRVVGRDAQVCAF